MKKCAYRIHIVDYRKKSDAPEEMDFHYDSAIDAVAAWDKFVDSDGRYQRIVSFLGAAGDNRVKHLFAERS